MREPQDLSARLRFVTAHLASLRDVLEARPRDGIALEPLVERGWDSYLASLDDETLDHLESTGLGASLSSSAPTSLRAMIEDTRRAVDVPRLHDRPLEERALRLRESARKRDQVEAFLRLVGPVASHAARVVDVGSGHGHLTRAVADRLGLPVLGLERDQDLAQRARTMGDERTTFAVTDVLRDGLPLSSTDCVIGLHACGELGDAMVDRAVETRAAIALVGCCLQKRRQEVRRAFTRDSEHGEALDLPRALLGLSNLTARDEGVEATRVQNLAARERRLALRRLIEDRGATRLRPGAEIDGLNRRVAQGDLETLVTRAFELRGWSIPSSAALDEAASWARAHHARMRRFALPRSMLARALEVFVLFDRAHHLERAGYAVTIGELFSAEISARNLAIAARP